jgi:hypothetical protein
MEPITTFNTGTTPNVGQMRLGELRALRLPDIGFRIERCSRRRIAA